MASLKITVEGAVRGGSSTASSSSTSTAGAQAAQAEANALKQVEALLSRTSTLYQQINADAAKALGAAVATAEKSAAAMVSIADRGVKVREAGEARVTRVTETESQKRLKKIDAEFAKTEKLAERMEKTAAAAAKKRADDEIREIERVRQARVRAAGQAVGTGLRNVGSGLVSGANTVIGGVQQAGATATQGAGAAFSQALQGRLLSGDLFRAGGTLVSAGARAGGQLASAIAKGAGDALPGALTGLGSIVGAAFGPAGQLVGAIAGRVAGSVGGTIAKAIGAGFSIAGELGGVLGTAAGEIAGFVGDKLGLALKITAGAAIAAAFVGIRQAARAEDVTPAFEKLAQVTGDSVVSALGKLREATKGTISDLDLMKNANRAAALGAAGSVEDFGKMAEAARQLGKTVGVDVDYALESMVLGVGRLSPRILDNIGLMVRLEATNETYAASVGKTADELSAAEQRAAVLAEVMRQVNARLDGREIKRASDEFDRLQTVTSNVGTTLGTILLPAAAEVAKVGAEAGRSFDSFLSNNKASIAGNLSQAVARIGNGLKGAFNVVKTIKLSDIFDIAKASAEAMWAAVKYGGAQTFDFLKGEATGFASHLISKIGGAAGTGLGLLGKLIGGGGGGSAPSGGGYQFGGTSPRELKFGGTQFGFGKGALGSYQLDINEAVEQKRQFETEQAVALKENNERLDALKKSMDDAFGKVENLANAIEKRANGPGAAVSSAVRAGVSGIGKGLNAAIGFLDSNPFAKIPAGGGAADVRGQVIEIFKQLVPGEAVEALTRFVDEAKILPDDMVQLRNGLKDQLQQIKGSELADRITKPLRDFADQQDRVIADLRNKEDDLKRKQDDAIQAATKAAEDRAAAELELAQKFRELHVQNFERYAAVIRSILADVQAKRNQLAGIGGGFEPQGGLPLGLAKGIRLARRRAEKQRFEDIRNDPEYGTGSAQNFADDPERIQRILKRQAEREVGAGRRKSEAFDEFTSRKNFLNVTETDSLARVSEATSSEQVAAAKSIADAAVKYREAADRLSEVAGKEPGGPKKELEQKQGDAELAAEALKAGAKLEEEQKAATDKLVADFTADAQARKASGEAIVKNLSTVQDVLKEAVNENVALKKRVEQIEASVRQIANALKK